MTEFELRFLQERRDKVFKRCRQDGFSERFLALKAQNHIKDSVGLMKYKNAILNAILNEKKNVLLFGGVGVGKTTFAFEIAFEIKEKNEDAPVYYNRISMLVSEHKANYSNLQRTIGSIFKRESYYSNMGTMSSKLIILDEVHRSDDYTLLSEIILSAYDEMKPLILIGNESVSAFGKKLDSMSFSRLKENSIILDLSGLKDLRNKYEEDRD